MKSNLERATPSIISGWFATGPTAYLSINGQSFNIKNGLHRPDLEAHGIPVESGFELTPENEPEIFAHIDRIRGEVNVQLLSDADPNSILGPNNQCIFINEEPNPASFQVEAPDESVLAAISGLSLPELRTAQDQFIAEGYCHLPSFYTEWEIEGYRLHLEYLWKTTADREGTIEFADSRLGPQRIPFHQLSSIDRRKPYTLNDFYSLDAFTRELTLSTRLSAVIYSVTQGIPMQVRSRNYTLGIQHDTHSPLFYLPPPAPATLIFSSICLEDVSVDAGPLSFWPKSHHCPPWTNDADTSHVRHAADYLKAIQHFSEHASTARLYPLTFQGKTGDVLLCHENLFQGRMPVNDPTRTQQSIDSHYWCYPHEMPFPEGFVRLSPCSGFLKRSQALSEDW